MTEERKITPDWHSEQFLKQTEAAISRSGEYKLEWAITKKSMIATLNYIRSKGYKCEWIEKREDLFMIKITPIINPS